MIKSLRNVIWKSDYAHISSIIEEDTISNPPNSIRDEFQIAIMLIEHDMNLVMNICEGICVLDHGRVIAKGSPEEIKANTAVIEAYLGKKKEAKD